MEFTDEQLGEILHIDHTGSRRSGKAWLHSRGFPSTSDDWSAAVAAARRSAAAIRIADQLDAELAAKKSAVPVAEADLILLEIQSEIEEQQLTMKQLSEQLGWAESALRAKLAGDREMEAHHLQQMAIVLGCRWVLTRI
ncbi:MAG: helix-turn-helix transcriptional regulator [Planctomycetota bacterium]